MKIMVTGGAGFIGSNLCLRLLKEGHEVVSVDCHFPEDKENQLQLKSWETYRAVRHDVIDPLSIDVDQIYHLACPASPIHYQQDPIRTFRTAVWGTYNMLDLARKLNIPILQASTSEVYGTALEHPQNENYWGNVNPVGLRSCYNEGKRGGESLCMDFHRQHGVKIRLIRIFNTYGPYLDHGDGRVVPNFIISALLNEPISIYGNGMQTRSFQYVDDLLEGMTRMMNNQSGFIGPVNLGNPLELTILDIAQKVIELTGSSSQLVFHPMPSDDPYRRKPDISLAKKMLDWEPRVSLEEGLLKTIEYFARNLAFR